MPNWFKTASRVLLTLPFFFVFWMVFVGTFASHELEIGLLATAITGAGLFVIDIHYQSRFDASLSEILSLWRIPWYLLSGTWEIVLVALKDTLGIKPAHSIFRLAEFAAGSRDNDHDAARRTLAVAYTTTAPNFIVLGINSSDQKLLFHQIERSSVPKMTKELGAKA